MSIGLFKKTCLKKKTTNKKLVSFSPTFISVPSEIPAVLLSWSGWFVLFGLGLALLCFFNPFPRFVPSVLGEKHG